LGATDKAGDVKAFLANLPAPSGSGADVYGTAAVGLDDLLDKAGTRLGAVILISDGVDPAAEQAKNASDNHRLFIEKARKRNVPVATIHVGRLGERKNDDDVKLRNGRTRLSQIAEETNGDLRLVTADANLEVSLRKELDDLGDLFAKVDRTTCQLCGKSEAKTGAVVDMKVKRNGQVLGQSLSSPPPRLDLPADDYGSCDLPATVSATGATVCSKDADCDTASKCSSGQCVRRRT
ncbi:MAG: hypothetical protein ACOYOB_20650, partial [Myxococcota bacterium]